MTFSEFWSIVLEEMLKHEEYWPGYPLKRTTQHGVPSDPG